MAAQGAADAAAATAGAAATPRPLTLLSLPDETLANLFVLLNERPGVALCLARSARYAHALAATHPRLDRLFRHELVTRLELKACVPVPASEMQRLLYRYPRATALTLNPIGSSVDVAGCGAPHLTVVELENARLCGGLAGVRMLLAQCRELEVLKFDDCVYRHQKLAPNVLWIKPTLGDEGLGAIASASGPRLRVLSLNNSAEGLTDAGGARLRDLTALTDLNLGWCPDVGAATLHAVAALPALASICLKATTFSEEHAAVTFPRMRALRKLDVSDCPAVGPWLWASLPPTLLVLHAEDTALLRRRPGDNCAAALTELQAGRPPYLHTQRWAALVGPHTRSLRVLSLTYSNLCNLGYARADAVLQAMPQLESLDLSYCHRFGDAIAAAVARHPALRSVNFNGTRLTGNRVTRAGAGAVPL